MYILLSRSSSNMLLKFLGLSVFAALDQACDGDKFLTCKEIWRGLSTIWETMHLIWDSIPFNMEEVPTGCLGSYSAEAIWAPQSAETAHRMRG